MRRPRRPFSLVSALTAAILFPTASVAGEAALPAGFVHLSAIDPTIRQDIAYAGDDNFLGRPAAGYEGAACILTRQAATALSSVQRMLAAEGLSLVVHDCYRPARAVADFVAWVGEGGSADPKWHPATPRGRLIAEGYIGRRSAHSRGSTVDVSIAAAGDGTQAPACGHAARGSLDFGTGFDCFDPASRTESRAVAAAAHENRRRLVEAMAAAGFRNYPAEWWHFTLRDEPFPRRSFDFPVAAP